MFRREVQICVFPRNQPGRFAEVCDLLFTQGIDIEYSYFSSGDPGSSALMIFMVSDLEAALRALTP